MSLTLDVFELSRTCETVEGTVPLSEMPELASYLMSDEGEGLRFIVTGLGIIERLPACRLAFEGDVVMRCARCNQPVTEHIESDLMFRFVKTEAEADALPLDEEGEDEEVIVGSRRMDVADWIQEEAILSLPSMPLHDDCDSGYENTPEDEVPEEEKRPNPFAALAALKKS